MNVVGLGTAGCNIAKQFGNYPQYTTFFIDSEKRTDENFLQITKKTSHEEYENKVRLKKSFFDKIKGDTMFIVAGAATVSGLSLRVLEKMKHLKPTILYIKSDTSLLPEIRKKQERVVFNVLQQYARSSLFEKMYIVDNVLVESILGDVPIKGYYDHLNSLIVSTMHMINVYKNSEAEMDTFSSNLDSARIATFGLVDDITGEEKLFYSLDTPREKMYYYAINDDQLKNDGSLFKKITNQVRNKVVDVKMKVSYGIYSTDYEQNYAYSVACASMIQEQNIL